MILFDHSSFDVRLRFTFSFCQEYAKVKHKANKHLLNLESCSFKPLILPLASLDLSLKHEARCWLLSRQPITEAKIAPALVS